MPYKIGDSIGIEFEVEDISAGIRAPEEIENFFHRHDDASIQTDAYRKGDILFNQKLKKDFYQELLGVEFVSDVLDSSKEEQLKNIVFKLTNWLSESGESLESYRAGIHIHVNMGGYNLSILKNLIKLSAKYEPVFYYLGGMGYEFRGIKNNFTYCRPITKYGPSCIKYRGNSYQILNIKDLLNAENTRDFFYRYGALKEDSPCGKYTPVRYGWITLYNLLKTQTVEFRVFNKCLNPKFLLAVIEICKAFCMRSFSSYPVNFEENSIYYTTKEQAKDIFEQMADELNLSEEVRKISRFIIKQTPEIKIDRNYYYTHLKKVEMDFRGGEAIYEFPIIEEEILQPNYVDLHVLRGEN